MKGQLLPLIDRGRFCPGRDCHVACGAPGFSCVCKPCYCTACKARTARARRVRLRGDVLPELAPRQPKLFYAGSAAA